MTLDFRSLVLESHDHISIALESRLLSPQLNTKRSATLVAYWCALVLNLFLINVAVKISLPKYPEPPSSSAQNSEMIYGFLTANLMSQNVNDFSTQFAFLLSVCCGI